MMGGGAPFIDDLWETPATSSLFDASVNKPRTGKTGSWAVHRLSSEATDYVLAPPEELLAVGFEPEAGRRHADVR